MAALSFQNLIHDLIVKPICGLREFIVASLYLSSPTSSVARYLKPRDHFAAHDGVRFEGYYTRILTEDRGTIIIIFSSVPDAKNCPYFVHASYTPPRVPPQGLSLSSSATKICKDSFPNVIRYVPGISYDTLQAFSLEAEGVGSYTIEEERQGYQMAFDDGLSISVNLSKRSPLFPDAPFRPPHGIFASLGILLPLHWHIFSSSSQANYEIKKDDHTIMKGTGIAHAEKNWGNSFPKAWTWIQGISKDNRVTFASAGGAILAGTAYMIDYRSDKVHISFAPPWTIMLGGRGLFISERLDPEKKTVIIDVSNFTSRLIVHASAPLDTWLPLHCPLYEGHGNQAAHESFAATIIIEVFQRRFIRSSWMHVETTVLEDSALEFGGLYNK
ncbi:hypothetical protein SISSUDRAFT_988727 [Sistotremastrum suecicum HHB10207 ss-3]|uniref:Uncharacterized protein n=1 Tax=Sistotremastrum suecicum HHB10207 ss-3 TaxID=1314776 RepID=A0A166BTY0_9AGAM|nr:hypothetical protein SISSUDRAFT_988727 [Sistotremastrum suecicum HHB10207 ss-3]